MSLHNVGQPSWGRFPKVQTTAITLSHQGRSFQFRQDGWFNMTQAALAFGKRLDKFWETAETRNYLDAMHAANPTETGVLFKAVRGQHGGGTWAHPKLAVFFARWLNVRFAVWCDTQRPSIFPR
jgi:KilA-N domain